MTAKEVCKRVWELSEPFAREIGVTLWDVTFEKEGGQYMLTITIDRDGHTDIDDCEALSRAVDPLLDGREFASLPPYTLCVSSAGLTRRLKRPEHFAAFLGSEVEVRFYRPVNGSKLAVGRLCAYDDGRVTLEADGVETVYEPKDIAAVRLSVTI
ncbi:MAG TPA: ribosome maturation factor RimP [Candidatus Butyricicoccus stercorigallinarum]|nr:ribosome maturation factor RimP [Candidatus Butyricicoccus stercorigallinarum]